MASVSKSFVSPNVITATEDTSLKEIAAILERHRIKRVPVIRKSELVGIVSRANLVQALASATLAPTNGVDKDRTIRQELEQSSTGFGGPTLSLSMVKVDPWGLVGSPTERTALTAIAEGVPRVTDVHPLLDIDALTRRQCRILMMPLAPPIVATLLAH